MEDTTRLKIILLGLFLAALALGYLIFSQRTATQEFQARPVTQMETTPSTTTQPESQPAPAAQTSQANTQTTNLPNTGVHEVLFGALSAAAMFIGLKLRKFSKLETV
ncbi:MAG: hypothetical protein CEO21_2 [Microgenomates group bacterium Gr01-1014_80]|nr:MAG: hypothetical protein CEO21_2 [Microgenomates group bacterium Gr01-1014_80]